jgi:hypothetical protein
MYLNRGSSSIGEAETFGGWLGDADAAKMATRR